MSKHRRQYDLDDPNDPIHEKAYEVYREMRDGNLSPEQATNELLHEMALDAVRREGAKMINEGKLLAARMDPETGRVTAVCKPEYHPAVKKLLEEVNR